MPLYSWYTCMLLSWSSAGYHVVIMIKRDTYLMSVVAVFQKLLVKVQGWIQGEIWQLQTNYCDGIIIVMALLLWWHCDGKFWNLEPRKHHLLQFEQRLLCSFSENFKKLQSWKNCRNEKKYEGLNESIQVVPWEILKFYNLWNSISCIFSTAFFQLKVLHTFEPKAHTTVPLTYT